MSRMINLLVIISCASGCDARSKHPSTSRDVIVFFADFDSEPIVGYHRDDIRRVGCRYTMPLDAYKKLYENRLASSKSIDWNDIKAELVKPDGSSIFVDAYGTLDNKGRQFSLDKEYFRTNLHLTGKCSPR